MSYFPPTGSTVAFQTDATKLAANVSVTGGFVNVVGSIAVAPYPASVSGVGLFNVNHVGNGSILSTLTNSSVAVLQGTNPFMVQLTSGSVITTGGNSSVQVVGLVPPHSVSGVGTFNIDPQGAGSIIAKLINSSVTAYQGVTPWVVQLSSGSVMTTGGNSSVMLTQGTNTIGSVAVLQGTNPFVTVGSVQGTMSVLGTVPVTQAGAWAVSIVGVPQPHSVAALQGTNPWVIGNSSVTIMNTVTGVFSVSGGFVRTEDNAHTTGDVGLFVLAVRNDAVASFTSANTDYSPNAVDSAGRTLIKPFAATEASIRSHASAVSGATGSGIASVVLFPAAGTGLRNYITDFSLSNSGATTTMVTFIDNDDSVLGGRWIVPAGGGNNPTINTPIANISTNNRIGVIISNSSSVVHIAAGGYKAP